MPKILIVDDEQVVAKVLEKLLKKHKYDTIIDNSPSHAIGYIKTCENIELIIADLKFPGDLSGINVIKEAHSRKIPFVVITGGLSSEFDTMKNELVKMNYPVSDILIKPIDFNKMLSLVEYKLKFNK